MNKAEIAAAIDRYLTEDNLKYSYDRERSKFRFSYTPRGKIKNLDYNILVSDDSYCVWVICPLGADADDSENMANMAEFLSRANWGLKNGNFEMDFRDGEIRYKTFVDLEDRPLVKKVFKNSILFPSAMFNRYGVGIIEILYGISTPEEAIRRIEE